MKLEYCHSETYNFGDDLNPWLWPKLLGNTINESSETYFLGIGTILTKKRVNERLKDAKKLIIFSSGAWDEELPILDERCQVLGVRGPRTAHKLGLSTDKAIGDGAYLLRKVELPQPESKPSGIGFIPHHRSEDYINWQAVCEQAGLKFISAKQPVEDFLVALQGCEKVVTEAMHGAIVADALRIPWVGAKFSPAFNEEKWYDFSEHMGISLQLETLPFMSQFNMKIGKACENILKSALAKIFPTPNKWHRLPAIFKVATDDDLAILSKKLKAIADACPGQLSTDERVEEVTERQYQLIKTILL
ncbi:succinoglycan biosynthesis protein exov [Photobacterium rosenbergii]|uniref:Succinoglycan biosynthesis protein exov n=1 Tax=Photobacterium rosenbergii TaxID=294936 RepID=A0A2T3NCT4_9GAMM|nr:polysaccharide pyruvyl transferase family protein [Photobacterium rosenbergii]PSW11830.1 succinoglycan biosynthesis protein exov [Photobacterium rosenbergii]